MPKIRRALLTVYDKRGAVRFARGLLRQGAKILSTGKTAALLKRNGIPVQEVSEVTGYPELLDGRVKSLHPKIHAAILANRSNRSHMKALKERGIEPIDLVAVDLYPFEKKMGKMRFSEAIELIDIGGVALLRAAAKNSRYVTAVPGPDFYDEVLGALSRKSGIRKETNQKLAYQAFQRTSRYDQAIRDFFGKEKKNETALPESLDLTFRKWSVLRYGENPHQEAALYVDVASDVSPRALSLQGRPLSFNNLLDLECAYRVVNEFRKPCVAVIKHAAPCGVGLGRTPEEAFRKAWACDPESAFGGVVGLNRALNKDVARRILKSGFLEAVAFPKIEKVALRILKRKKNMRLVPWDALYQRGARRKIQFRQLLGDKLLVQTEDRAVFSPSRLRQATKKRPTRRQRDDLLFAWKIAKHVHSNAVVIAKDQATVGIGGGQPSRVGSVRIALEKAKERTGGAVLASDGFFPFPDSVEMAAGEGISAMIQPGGSIRDREVVEACNRFGIAMVFTGIRHFKH